MHVSKWTDACHFFAILSLDEKLAFISYLYSLKGIEDISMPLIFEILIGNQNNE